MILMETVLLREHCFWPLDGADETARIGLKGASVFGALLKFEILGADVRLSKPDFYELTSRVLKLSAGRTNTHCTCHCSSSLEVVEPQRKS